MVRRLLRLGAAACFSAAAVLAWPASAGALEPAELGWWFKGNQDPAGVLPVEVTPPNVPEGGLYVANDPSGAAGVSALRFHVPAEEAAGVTVTLTVADSATFVELAVVACPAMASWVGAAGGDWGLRPEADCTTAAVPGSVDAEGTTVTWELDAATFAASGTYDVVIVPDPASSAPFQIPFEAPDDTTVQPSASAVTPTTAPPTFALEDLGVEEEQFSAPDTSFSAPAFDDPGPAGVEVPGTAGEAVGAGDDVAQAPAAVQPVLDDEGFSVERGIAVGVLVAMGAGLWLLSGRPAPAPKLIGGLAASGVAGSGSAAARPVVARAGVRPLVGGIGRFARPRTDPPTRV